MSLYPKPPVFDCSNGQSALERSLCSDERVEDLTLAVESVVQDRQVGGSEAEAQRRAAEQRQWAGGLVKACALSDKTPLDAAARGRAVSCLADEYQKRLVTLAVPAGRAAAAVWPGGMDDARATLARIQSDLERVAVGKGRWTLPEGGKPDALERIVDAYAAFLKNDIAGMDVILNEVDKTAVDRPISEELKKILL